jgi:molybdate transport system substrate-binding protein
MSYEPGRNWRTTLRRLIVAGLVVLGPGFLVAPVEAQDVLTKKILVFAASSLTDALGAVAKQYEKTSDDKVLLSFGSSSTLAQQIANGTPADIYASADVQWMDYLDKRGMIRARTRQNLLGNRLVLIAPKDSDIKPAQLTPGFPLTEWLGDGHLAMGNPASVPAGIYGKQALKSLKVWKSVRRKVAGTEDVRAALALVALGEAPLGVVYKTDALADDNVKIVSVFSQHTHPLIVYLVALTKESKGPGARTFFEYMTSDKAKPAFRWYGFITRN